MVMPIYETRHFIFEKFLDVNGGIYHIKVFTTGLEKCITFEVNGSKHRYAGLHFMTATFADTIKGLIKAYDILPLTKETNQC